MSQIRFTVADPNGTVSFVGPCHAIKMLVAGCAGGARTLDELLQKLGRLDERFAVSIRHGLAIFDEHNLANDTSAIERCFAAASPVNWPPFRVYDDATRDASTRPTDTGLIIFNLTAKRIVQVQNSYADIQRKDRGRCRKDGRPIQRLYHYELDTDWILTP